MWGVRRWLVFPASRCQLLQIIPSFIKGSLSAPVIPGLLLVVTGLKARWRERRTCKIGQGIFQPIHILYSVPAFSRVCWALRSLYAWTPVNRRSLTSRNLILLLFRARVPGYGVSPRTCITSLRSAAQVKFMVERHDIIQID